MKLRCKIIGSIAAVLLVGFVVLALTISHNSDCPATATPPAR